jgi:hypothetical protein
MSFSPGQQGKYRPMLARAWAYHSAGQKASGPAFDSWKREQLLAATGYTSTTQCSPAEDFEAAMAHFARLAGPEAAGDAVYWEMQAATGNLRRLRHTTGFDAPDAYFEKISQSVCGKSLAMLTSADRAQVVRRIDMQQVRQEKRGQTTSRPQRKEPDPF